MLVLSLQELALGHGMTLKDASAYNVQFVGGRPRLIDTSSFEVYGEGNPWIAYRQFCEHFLAPLVLMSFKDVRLGTLLQHYLDGIPIELVSKLLGGRAWLNAGLAMHVQLHARAQGAGSSQAKGTGKVSKMALLGLLTSLRKTVERLHWEPDSSAWSDYSSADSYREDAVRHKRELIVAYRDSFDNPPKLVWDLGANAGEFSRIFSEAGIPTVAWDLDHSAVEKNYRKVVQERESHLLPLVQDFANPSPALGWEHRERMSFLERGPADVSMALALIHHIVIGNSVPLEHAADFFAKTGRTLIIEFVGRSDPRVQQLLSSRTDTHDYDQIFFETAFRRRFDIVRSDPIRNSDRTMYLMRAK